MNNIVIDYVLFIRILFHNDFVIHLYQRWSFFVYKSF